MIGSVSVKYALRSLLRHPRRTLLSVLGVGIGCALGMIATAYYAGASEMMVRAASESGTGHLRVAPEAWPDTRDNALRLAESEKTLEIVRALPGLRVAAPRARTNGLLAFGTRTVGVEVLGVDPEAERASSKIIRKSKIEGRYLQPGDRGNVVIGRAIAKRLDVELDDDLMVTLAGRDEIRGAMLRIVGILDTPSRDLDATLCHVTLADIVEMTDYPGLGEIAILLENPKRIDAVHQELTEIMFPGNTVITWKVVNLGLATAVKGDTASIRLMSLIIIIVVMLGVTSAQLTAFLERRAEIGVLTALGMKGRQVAALILIEALATGIAGAGMALLLGCPVSYYIATRGIDITIFLSEAPVMMNVLFDPIIYGDFGAWLIAYALIVSVAATLASSIYPIWFTLKTNPVDAIRGT